MTARRQFDYVEVVGIAAIVGTILLCAVVLTRLANDGVKVHLTRSPATLIADFGRLPMFAVFWV